MKLIVAVVKFIKTVYFGLVKIIAHGVEAVSKETITVEQATKSIYLITAFLLMGWLIASPLMVIDLVLMSLYVFMAIGIVDLVLDFIHVYTSRTETKEAATAAE